MDLLTSITTGSAASLAISILLRPVWIRLAGAHSTGQSTWHRATTRNEALYLGAHAIAGVSLGWLYWLSWGLAALNITSWWMHGVIVGLAYALLTVLPMVVICSAVVRINKIQWWVLLGETLVTCIAVALACSWNWMQRR